jgi:hypothetical protein
MGVRLLQDLQMYRCAINATTIKLSLNCALALAEADS